jgi:hypothetical protein
VQGNQLPRDETDLGEVNTQLAEGLQSCRSLIANYKTLLSANDGAAANDDADLPAIDPGGDRA